jgi:DNA excision repair protein ERCC-2
VETRFRYREQYLGQVALSIHAFVRNHTGNYLVFFPSYKYMSDVLTLFDALEGDFEILCQQRDMDEASRDAFLAEFNTYGDTTRIGFCVMGGIFGEGIDLTGDRLTGVVIVGVGLPQVSPELEVMKNYYHNEAGMGFEYAYTYPGLTGLSGRRSAHTHERTGGLLLIDHASLHMCMLLLPRNGSHPSNLHGWTSPQEVSAFGCSGRLDGRLFKQMTMRFKSSAVLVRRSC